MAKIKLSKNELKRQKDALKRFLRYLPTLLLKKQQLQFEMRRIDGLLQETGERYRREEAALAVWQGVFGEEVGFESLLELVDIHTQTANIAGIDIPVFESVEFREERYDLFLTPLWVDRALETVKVLWRLKAEIAVLEEQYAVIARELRVTSQRINLFEKVKIPEARDNIRKIQIYLGDQQIAAVVRGKISKNKIVRRTR